jgi:hypothetical protein
MDEELEIQVGDVAAGQASAGCVEHHQVQSTPELDISGFDQFDQRLPLLETTLGRVTDHRVSSSREITNGGMVCSISKSKRLLRLSLA